MHEKKKFKCESKNEIFICPKNHFCVTKPTEDCIQCIHPTCTTKDGLALTKKLILELSQSNPKPMKKRNGGL